MCVVAIGPNRALALLAPTVVPTHLLTRTLLLSLPRPAFDDGWQILKTGAIAKLLGLLATDFRQDVKACVVLLEAYTDTPSAPQPLFP